MDSFRILWEMILGVVQITIFFWPLTSIILLMAMARIGIYLYKSHRYAKAGIADIDKFNGEAFEQYLESLFRRLGYKVQRTPYQGDYGADLVIQREGVKTVVQAKRFSRNVGVKAVQEAVAAKEYYRSDKMMVVTNSGYTHQARTLARANHVELWDRDALVSRILSSQKVNTFDATISPSVPTTPQFESQPATQTEVVHKCVQCGKGVSQRVVEYCMTHADIFQGNTYCYQHQKELSRARRAA